MSSAPLRVQAEAVAPQRWRNGGGQTRELLVWPDGGDWQLRISRADIAAPGPFSAFEGVQRWFVVVQGAGVQLRWGDREQCLQEGSPPLPFDGGDPPHCALLGGASLDLNLMLRRATGSMQAVGPQPWPGAHAHRGLYTACAGFWSDGTQQLPLGAHTLLWWGPAPAGVWTFRPAAAALAGAAHWPAWWLGFTPQGTA